MTNWADPQEILKDASIFQKLCLALLGLSTWEIVYQLPFDWSIISGKRKAQWPVGFYWYCKYSLWLAVVGVNIALNVTTKVDCQSLYAFNQFAGNTAIGSASTLLMLRTIAVWNREIYIVIPLVIISLGQWGILFHGIATVRSSWSDLAMTCVVDAVPPIFVELIYLYTMSFDFIVLLLSLWGLIRTPGRSSLWRLLFKQGVFYFFIAFIANLFPAVFLLLNLNPIMNIMFTIPAATATSIVACRAFVSLTSFRNNDVYVHKSVPLSGTRVASGPASSAGDLSRPDVKKPPRGTIAGIAFRGMAHGLDSMGETTFGGTTTYQMDDMGPMKGEIIDNKYVNEPSAAPYTYHSRPIQAGARGKAPMGGETIVDLPRDEEEQMYGDQKSFAPAM